MLNLDLLNAWGAAEAYGAFLRCCEAPRWAERMTARRPFASEAELFAAAEEVWRGLPREGWLQAFAAHPKIGDLDALRARFGGAGGWSAAEQAGVAGASEATLRALAEGNRSYEEKFGHIFIVCATGKGADEMLALLQQRLQNDPGEELEVAAREQEKITRLRLEKLHA